MLKKRFLRYMCSEDRKNKPYANTTFLEWLVFSKMFADNFLTFLWENNTLMGFPVLKPGETFRNFFFFRKKQPIQKS